MNFIYHVSAIAIKSEDATKAFYDNIIISPAMLNSMTAYESIREWVAGEMSTDKENVFVNNLSFVHAVEPVPNVPQFAQPQQHQTSGRKTLDQEIGTF